MVVVLPLNRSMLQLLTSLLPLNSCFNGLNIALCGSVLMRCSNVDGSALVYGGRS